MNWWKRLKEIAMGKKEPSAGPRENPAMGRFVRYVLKSGTERPAVITRVCNDGGLCNLTVFTDSDNDGMEVIERATRVPYSDEPKEETWHWPERE